MTIAFSKLEGLDAERILALVEPVLRAHGVEGVELIWKTDRSGWVLDLTLERPGSKITGAGITVELCTDISRDLSASFDVADVIQQKYRLQVGSPGVERALYRLSDYERFAGQLVKVKVTETDGRRTTHTGRLQGVHEGQIVIEAEQGSVSVGLERIVLGRLVFDWKSSGASARGPGGRSAKPRATAPEESQKTGESWHRKRA